MCKQFPRKDFKLYNYIWIDVLRRLDCFVPPEVECMFATLTIPGAPVKVKLLKSEDIILENSPADSQGKALLQIGPDSRQRKPYFLLYCK